MKVHKARRLILVSVIACHAAAEDTPPLTAAIPVPLTVSSGVPLRLYLTQRLHMRNGELVRAKLIESTYAFDRVVVPAGVEVLGHVTELDPAPKIVRAQAILGGDFSPLHTARVEFTTILMPDGRQVPIHTIASTGLDSIFSPPRPSKKKPSKKQPQRNPGVTDTVRQEIRTQINGQINARTRGIADLVRGPNKLERVEDFLITKLPYHPQWYRRGTRFDAVLRDPLDFGAADFTEDALRMVGLEPATDKTAQVRLLSAVTSMNARKDDKVNGVLSQPLFSSDNKLVLPEGTRLAGTVRQARPARWFHRNGQLRFTFDQVELPELAMLEPRHVPSPEAHLLSAEADARAGVKIDEEGTAKATESKKRLLGPAIALLAATKSLDNDTGKKHQVSGTGNGNYGGRAAGGFSGFGLLGMAASRASRTLGSALGFYGLAWSVYSTIISRGQEVEFPTNTPIEIQFGSRTPAAPPSKGNHLAQVRIP
jgi:hypothetical protein